VWGKGGRGFVTALLLILAVSVPLASSAARKTAHPTTASTTWVSPALLRGARLHPNKLVHVIIQSVDGNEARAADAFDRLDRLDETADARQTVNRRLRAIGAVAATVRADKVATLAKVPNLTVTPDSLVEASGYSSKQL